MSLLRVLLLGDALDRSSPAYRVEWMRRVGVLFIGGGLLFAILCRIFGVGLGGFGIFAAVIGAFLLIGYHLSAKLYKEAAALIASLVMSGCVLLVMSDGPGPQRYATATEPAAAQPTTDVEFKPFTAAPYSPPEPVVASTVPPPAQDTQAEPAPARYEIKRRDPKQVFADSTTRLYHAAGCPLGGSLTASMGDSMATLQGYRAHECAKRILPTEEDYQATGRLGAQAPQSVPAATPAPLYAPTPQPAQPTDDGLVHVKGYTKKDGTYVAPHTRKKAKGN